MIEVRERIAAYRAGDVTWEQLRADLSERTLVGDDPDLLNAPGSYAEVSLTHDIGLLTRPEYTEIKKAAWAWQEGLDATKSPAVECLECHWRLVATTTDP